MSKEAPPFELQLERIATDSGDFRELYSFTLNPSSGIPDHLLGGWRTTGCSRRAAAEAFVRQRIAELQRGSQQTFPLTDCTELI